MTTTQRIDLKSALDDLAPLLREEGKRAEDERRLTDRAVNALRDAGFFRVWAPRQYGGLEMDLVSGLELFEELSRIEGAAGWVVGNAAAIHTICQVMPEEAVDDIFSVDDAIVAGGWFPPGRAVPVNGGYDISGRWQFASACHHATYHIGMALVMDGAEPRRGPDGDPVQMLFVYPAEEGTIVDNWNTIGMRGTGSHDLTLDDHFVPSSRTFLVAPFTNPAPAFGGPLYRFSVWIAPIEIAVQILGEARAAVEALLELAPTKAPSYTTRALSDSERAQTAVAQADAMLRAARAFLYETARTMWDEVQGGDHLSLETGLVVQQAGSFARQASVEATQIVHEVAGTSGIREEQPFERLLRDVHTLQQNAFIAQNRYESVGKVMLGRDSDWPFFYL